MASDSLRQVGRAIRKTKTDSEYSLRRYNKNIPLVERTRDIFDSNLPFEMQFETDANSHRIMLDLAFNFFSSYGSVQVIKIATLTKNDLAFTGQIIDLIPLQMGTVVLDIFISLTESWANTSSPVYLKMGVDFGGINETTFITGANDFGLWTSQNNWNDSSLLSGNDSAVGTSLLKMSTYGEPGSSHLPTEVLVSTILQAKVTRAATSSTTGSVDIWIIKSI